MVPRAGAREGLAEGVLRDAWPQSNRQHINCKTHFHFLPGKKETVLTQSGRSPRKVHAVLKPEGALERKSVEWGSAGKEEMQISWEAKKNRNVVSLLLSPGRKGNDGGAQWKGGTLSQRAEL